MHQIDRRDLIINLLYIVFVAFIFIALRKYIIIYLFSEKFAPAIPVLALLTLAAAMNGLSIPYTTFFKAHKEGAKVRNITFTIQVVISLTIPVLYFGLNLVLIPALGIIGAALAAIIAFSLDYILYLIQYRKLFRRS